MFVTVNKSLLRNIGFQKQLLWQRIEGNLDGLQRKIDGSTRKYIRVGRRRRNHLYVAVSSSRQLTKKCQCMTDMFEQVE
jgi:hypothetical protein